MRKKRSWRYYCDHCGKSGGRGDAMLQHERHCTLNPTRECRMCALVEDNTPVPMPELVAALRENGVAGVRKAASGCPACMLAAIRQDRRVRGIDLRKADMKTYETESQRVADFDYRQESQAYMTAAIQLRKEEARYAYC